MSSFRRGRYVDIGCCPHNIAGVFYNTISDSIMTTFKITLEYDGTRYSGWQEQKNARTVMGEVRKAAEQVFDGDVEMQAAGRTDAGVHALGQVMHIKVASEVRHPPALIARRLNDLLPADIAVLSIERAPRNFHARHDAIARVYLYQISRRKQAFTKMSRK